MSHEVPENLKEYFGHDKVAHRGRGGMPAAPPAPPGSTARRAGENAVADALSKVGKPGPRAGSWPATAVPRPAMSRLIRMKSEQALMEASMRRMSARTGAPHPHAESPALFRTLVAPVYRAIPWPIKKRIVSITSGVKGWTSGK